jgi:hypothetical protein
MLVAFNTAPGSVAPIENGPYGAFAQALAEMIGTGGLGLDDVFARLRLRVNETTGGVAVPWYASKIAQPFLLTEATPDAPPPPQQVASTLALQSQPIQQFRDDQEAYMAALERDTIAGYEEFIAAFPNSPHVRRFRALIAVRREAIMWRRVLSINTREAYWSYLERYPQGAHAADCERRLTRLAAEWDPPQGFVPMAFADVAPPPPDEVVYLTQPEIVFNDPVFVAPPPVPVFFCPPRPREFVALVRAPPPPPVGAFFLPAPTVTFFSGPRPWVRPPVFVAPPPRPVIQQITINNTTIINQRPGGAAPMSPALPGTVVARINTGALRAPPWGFVRAAAGAAGRAVSSQCLAAASRRQRARHAGGIAAAGARGNSSGHSCADHPRRSSDGAEHGGNDSRLAASSGTPRRCACAGAEHGCDDARRSTWSGRARWCASAGTEHGCDDARRSPWSGPARRCASAGTEHGCDDARRSPRSRPARRYASADAGHGDDDPRHTACSGPARRRASVGADHGHDDSRRCASSGRSGASARSWRDAAPCGGPVSAGSCGASAAACAPCCGAVAAGSCGASAAACAPCCGAAAAGSYGASAAACAPRCGAAASPCGAAAASPGHACRAATSAAPRRSASAGRSCAPGCGRGKEMRR